MTMLITKPVRREVSSFRHGPLIVTLAFEGVYYREKGRRKSFLIPHGVAFQNAVLLHLARERIEKAKVRALRKTAKATR